MVVGQRSRISAMRRTGLVAIVVIGFVLGGVVSAAALGDAVTLRLPLVARNASAPYPVNRVGVGFLRNGSLADYPLDRLPFGWYVDYGYRVMPERPRGIAYIQVLPVGSGYPPDWEKVEAAVLANPGSVWIIGNEPECPISDGGEYLQGNLTPQEYAEIYHAYYTTIIGWDPTARFAVGGVVQPSPARFLWLEKTLEVYQTSYEAPMPIDVWNIHNMILEEEPDNLWGGGVPRGLSPSDLNLAQTRYAWWPIPERLVGGLMRYEPCDNRRADYFERQLWAFRRWMAANGFRDQELWITEYGVLYPAVNPNDQNDWLLFTGYHRGDEVCLPPYPNSVDEAEAMGVEVVNAFMSSTLDYAATARDARYGMPSDDNRLIQRWLWYSLDDVSFNGNLCDPAYPHELTAYGLHWEAYFDR